ncbi:MULTISPECIES: SDR family oxidoreductase [Actinomycetes]|uniref:SDR family NAD(P)-dependent oxidoreductase n=1 Tax=Actinomycetes TaxID=1760 RepID=UPI0004BF7BD7|nr:MULTISPECIES: SDR family oxidoreductase [Actinomycetes]
MPAGLESRVAIVTGSGSGIGRDCARALAAEGAQVIVADINEEMARETVAGICADGGLADAIRVDLGDPLSIEAMVRTTVERFGRLDILHNNAAATHLASSLDGDIAEADPALWEATFRINVTGTMLATKFSIPHLLASDSASIINTSSDAGHGGDFGHTAYGVSKAGINALTQYTAAQYGKAGIRCNAIAPGLIVTPATADNYAGPGGDMMKRHHLTPRLGTPADIAAMVVFLASPASGFVTGQIIHVDGGLLSHQPYLADVAAARGKVTDSR